MRRARWPTVTRPCLSMRTTLGVTVPPWAFRITWVRSPSNTAAALLLVPSANPSSRGPGAVVDASQPKGSAPSPESALAIDDEPAGGVVRRDGHRHAVTEHHADAVAADLAGKLGQHLVAVLQLHAEV